MLHRLSAYMGQVETHYNNHALARVVSSAIYFSTDQLSAEYFDSVKDRLYCGSRDGESRRAAQTVLEATHRAFLLSIAPILPFLAEEAHAHRLADEARVRGLALLDRAGEAGAPPSESETVGIQVSAQGSGGAGGGGGGAGATADAQVWDVSNSVFLQRWASADLEWTQVELSRDWTAALATKAEVARLMHKAQMEKTLRVAGEALIRIEVDEGSELVRADCCYAGRGRACCMRGLGGVW
jgi:isoleucyl-tRNA synthetase